MKIKLNTLVHKEQWENKTESTSNCKKFYMPKDRCNNVNNLQAAQVTGGNQLASYSHERLKDSQPTVLLKVPVKFHIMNSRTDRCLFFSHTEQQQLRDWPADIRQLESQRKELKYVVIFGGLLT